MWNISRSKVKFVWYGLTMADFFYCIFCDLIVLKFNEITEINRFVPREGW